MLITRHLPLVTLSSVVILRTLPWVVPALALLLFFALGAYQLDLPGLQYDEAKEAGLNAMQLVTGQPVTAFRDATLRLGPVAVPLMVQDYIGALNVVLATPFLAIGGIGVPALRWLPLLAGGITLLLASRLAGRLGGPRAAGATAILLAVNPSFLFWSRQGIFVTNLTALFFVASLLAGLRWWQDRRPGALWVMAFCWGLGLYAKLLFAWAIGAMFGVAVLAWLMERLAARGGRDTAVAPRPGPSAQEWLIAGACFLLPLVPLILFNVQTEGTITSVLTNLGQSYYGVNNRAYLPNLATRLDQLVTLLRGDHFWYLGELFANPWAPWLAASLLLLALFAGRRPDRRRLLGLVAVLALMVAQSAFTVSDLFITHDAMLLPLIPVIGGLSAGILLDRRLRRDRRNWYGPFHLALPLAALAGRRVWSRATGGVEGEGIRRARALLPALAGGLLLLGWAGSDAWTTVRYHQVLSLSGGYSSHSDAINHLAADLGQRGAGPVVALDWGFQAPIAFLTAGRVDPIEVFGYTNLDSPDAEFAARVLPYLEHPDARFLAHMPEATVFQGRVDALKALAAERGLAVLEEARFAERSGRPLLLLYRLASAGAG